jgi:hypothetical protein
MAGVRVDEGSNVLVYSDRLGGILSYYERAAA